jgi:hypothetical protein
VSPVKYELGFYIPEDDILHSHRPDNFKCHNLAAVSSISLRKFEHKVRKLSTFSERSPVLGPSELKLSVAKGKEEGN